MCEKPRDVPVTFCGALESQAAAALPVALEPAAIAGWGHVTVLCSQSSRHLQTPETNGAPDLNFLIYDTGVGN